MTFLARPEKFFQKAEYLRDHGMVDMVLHRHEMRATIAKLCRLLTKAPVAAELRADPRAESRALAAPAVT